MLLTSPRLLIMVQLERCLIFITLNWIYRGAVAKRRGFNSRGKPRSLSISFPRRLPSSIQLLRTPPRIPRFSKYYQARTFVSLANSCVEILRVFEASVFHDSCLWRCFSFSSFSRNSSLSYRNFYIFSFDVYAVFFNELSCSLIHQTTITSIIIKIPFEFWWTLSVGNIQE